MDEKKEGNKIVRMRDKPWLCSNCKYMLGVISSDSRSLRLKYKDFYVLVEGGNVRVLCRRCGETNELVQEGVDLSL